MKKIALILGAITTALVLVGCASKAKEQPVSDAPALTAPAHHDVKGERI